MRSASGEDEKVHPLDLKAGDRVLFGKWSGTEIRIDGEELMIMIDDHERIRRHGNRGGRRRRCKDEMKGK